METKEFFEKNDSLTFDDVLLQPWPSEVLPTEVNLDTYISKNIKVRIPLISAPMDTVTESSLAISIAQLGGVGIIHRNSPVEHQVKEIDLVKRYESVVIKNPITLPADKDLSVAKEIMEESGVSGIPIVEGNKLIGIITSRDLRFEENFNKKIYESMTHPQSPRCGKLITAPEGTSLEVAKSILHEHRIEKLPLVDEDFNLKGLITVKDIEKKAMHPDACRDDQGRLLVGAAIGVNDYDRLDAIINAGIDVVVVDTAHGAHKNVLETVRKIKKEYSIDVIAGNIANAESAKALLKAGADGLRVGVGPGSICTTRVVAGIGVPQLTAIYQCSLEASKYGVPVIADGGIKFSGDIAKAIAAGAHTVMMGGIFAGVEESPGDNIIYKGRKYKQYRGMGSVEAMQDGDSDRYMQNKDKKDSAKLVPEGISGRVAYKGPLEDVVYQLLGGLKSSMGYTGCKDLDCLRDYDHFVKITAAGLKESHPHDVDVTSEAPNYSTEDKL